MPNGVGFSWPAHPLGREYAALGDMTVAPGPGGLTRAATLGLQRLLDLSNVRLVGPRGAPSQAQRNRHDRPLIVVGSLGVLAAAVVARFFKRRANAAS